MNWVIWSEEHGAWWAPGKQGYTRSLIKAGRYSLGEAKEISTNANQYCRPGEWKECVLPDPFYGEQEA